MEKPFYGWAIVAASFIILATAYGMQFSYGLFVPYFESEFGLSRANATAPLSVYIVVYSILSFTSGRLTDQFGPRKIVATGGLLLATGYMLLSRATELWQAYLFLGIISGIGMSATFIPLNATVVKWFVEKRGTALAITGTGVNLGVVLVPIVVTALLARFDWRFSLLIMAIATAFLISICSLFLTREPGSANLRQDGNSSKENISVTAGILQSDWTRKEALKTSTFWIILSVFLFTWAIIFFPYAHLPSLANDVGLGKTYGAKLLAALGIGGFTGRVVVGILSDSIGRRGCLFIALGAQVLACALLAFLHSPMLIAFAAISFGFGAGSTGTLFAGIVGDYFGRKHVGEISGLIFAVTSSVSALGPYIGGFLRDLYGGYQQSFVIGAVFNLVAIILLIFLKLPVHDIPDK